MAKILIADDHQLMRSALKTIFAMRQIWKSAARLQTDVKQLQKYRKCSLT
jgi:DNA-binding NarL/FixJ family response regulator